MTWVRVKQGNIGRVNPMWPWLQRLEPLWYIASDGGRLSWWITVCLKYHVTRSLAMYLTVWDWQSIDMERLPDKKTAPRIIISLPNLSKLSLQKGHLYTLLRDFWWFENTGDRVMTKAICAWIYDRNNKGHMQKQWYYIYENGAIRLNKCWSINGIY